MISIFKNIYAKLTGKKSQQATTITYSYEVFIEYQHPKGYVKTPGFKVIVYAANQQQAVIKIKKHIISKLHIKCRNLNNEPRKITPKTIAEIKSAKHFQHMVNSIYEKMYERIRNAKPLLPTDKQPQFACLKFHTRIEFNAWLQSVQYVLIQFAPNYGTQILMPPFYPPPLYMYVHHTGEILHTYVHGEHYIGKFIDLTQLHTNKPLCIWEVDKQKFVSLEHLIPSELKFYPVKV